VLQRATKPAKELIAQNPPQDCLQTRATSGLVYTKQAAAADVAETDRDQDRKRQVLKFKVFVLSRNNITGKFPPTMRVNERP